MKRIYEAPVVELTSFDAEDIILTSVTNAQQEAIDSAIQSKVTNDGWSTANAGTQNVFVSEENGFNW